MSSTTIQPSPSTTTTTTTRSQPSSQACAACKYQRRRCKPDCTLAPYFPADHQRQFLNAHRLFGVSNMLKIIRGLDPLQRSEAMQSIIFQSNVRAHDPVGGCYRIILELERHIERDSAELSIVLRNLEFYRAQSQQTANVDVDVVSPAVPLLHGNNDAALYPANNVDPAMQQQYHDYFCYDGGGGGGGDGDDDDNKNNSSNSHSNSNSINNYNNNTNNNLDMEVPHSVLSLQQQYGVEEGEEKQLVNMFDVRPEFDDDSKDAAETNVDGSFLCSNKMELREELNLMEHFQEHDLQGAASLFTLTNYNSSAA